MSDTGPSPARVAYLTSVYPKLSHSFIASEIRGVRAAGIEVDTVSVNRPDASELLSPDDVVEFERTLYLIDSARRDLARLVVFAARHPGVVFAGAREALRFCRGAARGKRIFYLVEALVLVRALAQRGIRHVHVHLANNSADVAHLAVTMGRRLDGESWSWSLAVHGPNELIDVGAYNLARKAVSAEFVACITDFCRSQVMMLVPRSRWPRLHVVRMGIALDRFPALERDRHSHRPLRVLFVGRLVAEKAPQVLLDALADFAADDLEVRIIGAGPLDAELAERVEADGLSSVELVGPVLQSQLPEHYRWADVFCLPSFAEGLPVVIMEAMATGLPVVSTHIAGIPELVTTGRTGVLVAPGNAADLATALRAVDRLAGDPAVAAEARDAVARNHDALTNAAELAALLRSVSSASAAGGATRRR